MKTFVKFHPFAPVATSALNNIVDDLFNRSIGDLVGSDFAKSHPSVNILENENGYHIELAAPGLQKDDFKINIEKNNLVIAVEKESKEEVNEGKYKRREFNYSAFKRSFHLPETINADGINATYDNGILSLQLPKKELAQPEVKTISIV